MQLAENPTVLIDRRRSLQTRIELGHDRRRRWRIMMLLSNLAVDGGAEVQCVELASRLKARGWQVSVVSLLAPDKIDDRLAAEGIPVHVIDAKGVADAPRAVWKLSRLLRKHRPHILHSHMSHALIVGRAARMLQSVPVLVGTLHGLKMYNVRGTGFRAREILTSVSDRLSDVTTAVCNAAARHYRSSRTVSAARMRVVPNGVDTVRFQRDPEVRRRMRAHLKIADGDFAWLMVGRFQPVKDHYTMLRAFVTVLAHRPNSQLLLAGDGPFEKEMSELAQALGIGASVRFLGYRADIAELMNAADAFVLSSMFEAMPLVLLEAGASGLPAVATDVGGNADVIEDGVTGLLCPPGDPDSLAHTMIRLAALSAYDRDSMGLRAAAHVKDNYGFERIVDQWERLYADLLAKKGVRQ